MSWSSRQRRGLSLKRSLLALGIVLFLIALAIPFSLALWARQERGAVAQRVAAIQAMGEPILPGDFVDASVPAERNLVVPIREAIASLVTDLERDGKRNELEMADEHAFTLPLSADEVALLQAGVEANAAALAALSKLDGRAGVAWGDPWQSFFDQMNQDDQTRKHLRALANLLGDAAKLAARDGRTADAVTLARRCDAIADAVAERWSLIDMLVAHGIRALSADQAFILVRAPAPIDPAARPMIETWIASLLDDGKIVRSTRNGLLVERASQHEVFTALASGTVPGGANAQNMPWRNIKRVAGLAWRSDRVVLDALSEMLRLADASDRAASEKRAGTLRQITRDASGSKLSILASVMLPSFDRLIANTYRVRTDRHLAATALAIRLYRLDHNDQWPATLDALVPTYLPAVPVDADNGLPLRYDRERMRLWGVGENGVDDGGVARDDLPSNREFAKRGDNTRLLGPASRPTRQIEADEPLPSPGDDKSPAPATATSQPTDE